MKKISIALVSLTLMTSNAQSEEYSKSSLKKSLRYINSQVEKGEISNNSESTNTLEQNKLHFVLEEDHYVFTQFKVPGAKQILSCSIELNRSGQHSQYIDRDCDTELDQYATFLQGTRREIEISPEIILTMVSRLIQLRALPMRRIKYLALAWM